MTFVLVDNYDSFTYNLYQSLATVTGAAPLVIANDDEDALRRLDLAAVTGIVVSPGPGTPADDRDFGLSRWAVEQDEIPMLGICLGHQGLCLAAGARIDRAPVPMHGRCSEIHHDGDPLLEGIPSPFTAMRYHSLLAYDLPDHLEVICATADGLVMGARHAAKPHWGVQFHPESIATEHGETLLANFVRLASARRGRRPATDPAPAARRAPVEQRYRLLVRELPFGGDAGAVLVALFGDDDCAFWLDSALQVPGLSRFSILGGSRGPLAERVSYDVGTRTVTVTASDGAVVERFSGDLLSYLARELPRRRVAGAGLPVDFALGYVGYLGYELKADTGGAAVHRSGVPDAQLLFADRGLVVDHEQSRLWLLALQGEDTTGAEWLDRAEGALRGLAALPPLDQPAEPVRPVSVRSRHSDDGYLRLIAECQRLIGMGESYEICLTNVLEVDCPVDPWTAYRRLRVVNPAPFGAWLRLPGVAVLSSSPERFLRLLPDGVVESRPIKGTCPRGATPEEDERLARALAASEKERAENIMIVDLVRNDIGRGARVGSVSVPQLCGVETYETVHQLVSTVRGELRDDVGAAECVRHAFPGGSVTGAPKVRTMEIIDRLEGGPRGVYCGAIGYFSLDGAVDLSIAIRTIVVAGDGDRASIGVGGAITALSEPAAEVRETWLKAAALLSALTAAAGQPGLSRSGRSGRAAPRWPASSPRRAASR
ncbi:MAG: aminodeoxychorismate synthase component I [Frankiaceae bacterium]